MKSSRQDKIEAAAKRAHGALKKQIGRLDHDARLRDAGDLENAEGLLQSKSGDLKRVPIISGR